MGTISGSVAITADALNNLSDASSAIVTLIGFRLAQKPADEDHPYGHARSEYLSGLAVSMMILLIGFELAKTSLSKVFHPTPVAFSWVSAAVLVGSIGVKLMLNIVNGRLSRKIDSAALAATAADSRNDCIATGSVLLAAVISEVSGLDIDGYVGLAVAAFILFSGWNMAKETISPLLGEAADPQLQRLIVECVRTSDKILGYHDLLVHDYGPGQRFASIHVEMDKDEDPLVCHTIIDNIERTCLQQHRIHLVIHYDPIITDDEELILMRERVRDTLKSIDERISFHDFRMVRSHTHINLIFDIALPTPLQGQEKQIKQMLDHKINEDQSTQYYTVITFDSDAFNTQDLWM